MVSLGGAFPADYQRQHVLRHLIPGKVIKLREVMDDGQIHEKRFVLLRVDDDSVCCVINSQVSRFIQNRPDMLRCQVAMAVADHVFMDHDSHVDCSRTKNFTTARVVRELMDRPEWILGDISVDLRDEIIVGLKFSPTLSVKEVETLCGSLAAGATQ
jgi:hypothetical protein